MSASERYPWPTAPLVGLVGSEREICMRLGWTGKALPDRLSDVVADRWAIATGFHPSEVWGQAWFDYAIDPDNADIIASNRARTPIRHGTIGGYTTHRRRGVPMCFDCQEAKTAYGREHRQRARAS